MTFIFFDEPVFSQIEKIEHYCLNNITDSSIHTHNGVSCRSSQLVYFRSYSRHYVSFHHDVHDDMMTIPVLYCKNDGHYHALIKREWLNFYRIMNYGQAYHLVFEYIEGFYNITRIHSHCNYLSPMQHEQNYRLAKTNKMTTTNSTFKLSEILT